MLDSVRIAAGIIAHIVVLAAALFAVGCGTKSVQPAADQTDQAWYLQNVQALSAISRDAQSAFEKGKPDEAAALIEKGQPLMKTVLSVPRPTFAAVAAASDLDDLYGRMLLSNRHYGWARLLFQKNIARWKHWTPPTPETARRLKLAETEIAECDRHID
jgi:hypothetical protein